MKNVLINKIVEIVVTENQLRSFWKKLGNDLEFETLSNEQLMKLAMREIQEASLTELDSHLIDRGWRTRDEIEGKMIAEDNSNPRFHVELIDTDQEGTPSKILIDRMLELQCNECGFNFFIQDTDMDANTLICPKDGGKLTITGNNAKKINKN
ncbi:hypothetical protein M670_02521 [Schinkia azotoformans MEV2011]|uniref:Uncharacterized protein n=1 Tax=Schinkia azotoformans MEV2011 TaxID=1348973 RepID=A0A072NMJ6_SCHAZ|nr:hypothetical protein [Schinkia azotoformans]KEF38103.1 hypothetical protein M670_02521 [Schinkia azotoformans MEV2011]MEC1696663.1 hypothetical protein [Schinkia azotoformans]MEC1715631.1 hypothetical protein [Schinkia azotoformans]MEC1726137.1 hypothetical protein [Schinkia azotoformans]MEC1742173.1 hypothetical protein [Schinkia azotoformans]